MFLTHSNLIIQKCAGIHRDKSSFQLGMPTMPSMQAPLFQISKNSCSETIWCQVYTIPGLAYMGK